MHLVDSHYCADPAKFISVLCTSLSTMLHVELPHVNVLSKMDLIEQYGKLGKRLLASPQMKQVLDTQTEDCIFQTHTNNFSLSVFLHSLQP